MRGKLITGVIMIVVMSPPLQLLEWHYGVIPTPALITVLVAAGFVAVPLAGYIERRFFPDRDDR